ncbi:MAG: MATE family efflux transporter [Verrucomicrobiae bacterium]|nr:MATE family efflux transporter [Verrucomicrobiae bacterium]
MNLTADPIPRLVRDLAVPASIGFFFNTMFNVVDTWWAGRIATQAQAALSLSFPVFFILIAMGSGLAQGATALIANALGAGDIARARHYAAQAALFGVGVGAVLTVLGLLVAPSLFRLLGASDEYLRFCLAYMNPILAGSVFFLLQSVLNGGLQAQGDTRTFRNVLIAGCLLNAILDPWFLYGGLGIPPMGIAGIALSTLLITAAGAAYIARCLRLTPLGRGLRATDFRPSSAAFRDIARQGLPASLNMMTVALGIFVITWFVSRFSAKGVAAYGIATRIEQIILLPTIGLNIATLTLCGQNFGAGRLDRVRETWRIAVRYGLILMGAGGVALLLGAGPLMRVFSQDPAVIDAGITYLRVAALTLGSYVILYQTVFMLQGLKRPMFGLWIGLFRQILAPALVFPLLAFTLGLGLHGIWWGIALVNWGAALAAWSYGRSQLRNLAPSSLGSEAVSPHLRTAP